MMYYNIIKSVKYRIASNNFQRNKWFLNIILKNHLFFFNLYKYNLMLNYTSITKIRNRCIINGRSRSVCSKYRLSRFFFKHLAVQGKLVGIIKK